MDLKGKTGSIFYSIATLDGSNIYMLKSIQGKGTGKLLHLIGVSRALTTVQIQM